MGKPLMLRDDDYERIEMLRMRTHARTKIDVVRSALDLLEGQVARAERVEQWQRAAKLVSTESRRVLHEFQRHSRLRRVD